MACPGKLNGRQWTKRVEAHGGLRDQFINHLRSQRPRPPLIVGECILYWAIHYRLKGRPDSSGALAFIEDCIQADLKYGFPLIKNDSLIVGYSPFPEYGLLNRIRNSPKGDLIEFALRPL